MWPLISSSNDANCVTSSLLVLFVLKTSNYLSISSISIYSSFTSCLLVLVWVHSNLTNILNHSFFFRKLLCIEIHYTMPTLNLRQNSPLCYCLLCFHCLNYIIYFCSSPSILTCSSLWGVLFCCIYNTFWFLFLSSVSYNSFLYFPIYYN